MTADQERDQARRRAVQTPADVEAMLSSAWPPTSRDGLALYARALRRSAMIGGIDQTKLQYLQIRIRSLLDLLKGRSARYAKTGVWTVDAPDGKRILLPLNDRASQSFRKVAEDANGRYESALVDYVWTHLRPEDVFVDVGAHVGYVSAFAAAAGAVVFAVEVQRELIPLIEQLATINGFDRLRVVHAGASARAGMIMVNRVDTHIGFQLTGLQATGHWATPRSILNDFVPTLTLDDAFGDGDLVPRMVKIDVEGHEIDVLDGARRLIALGRTTFVVEYHPHLVRQYGRSDADLLAHFDRDRWTLAQLSEAGLAEIDDIAQVVPDPNDPNPKLVFTPRSA